MKRKLVKVRMSVNTAYQGPRKEGDELFVPEDFAKRWVKNGIAVYIGEQEADDEVVEEPTEETEEQVTEEPVEEAEGAVEEEAVEEAPVVDENNYDALTAKELYELCKEQGLDVEAKKSKAYYIEKLEAEAATVEE